MGRQPKGVLARCLTGRLDRSVLSDVGVLVGLGLCVRGLWLLSSALGWIGAGVALVVLSVMAVLPPKSQAPKAPKGTA